MNQIRYNTYRYREFDVNVVFGDFTLAHAQRLLLANRMEIVKVMRGMRKCVQAVIHVGQKRNQIRWPKTYKYV